MQRFLRAKAKAYPTILPPYLPDLGSRAKLREPDFPISYHDG